MVSLRFPFSFFQPPKHPRSSHGSSRSFSASAMAGSVAAAVGAGIGLGIAISHKIANQRDPFLHNALDLFFSHYGPNSSLPMWGSLSLTDNPSQISEPKTGASFPSILNKTRQLLGIGLRKKNILGLKNIDVYAFGVYADDGDIKKLLSEKYGKLSVNELNDNKEFSKDVLEQDICMTVRLQIVYSRLSIRSVRSAFEESVGSKLQKFGGSVNKELLQRFTSQFKDEIKLPRGSVIELSRERGYLLRTTIDGEEVGTIQSKLLCQSVLDLYIGEDSFDKKAKEDIKLKLASLLQQ